MSGRRGSPADKAGFTLVEMLIALAVLASSLAILLGSQAANVRSLELANQMHIASLLVHSQMLRVEEELRKEGFSTGITTSHGDFRDDGFDQYEWLVEIEPVEITDDASDQFVANVQAELFGDGTTGAGSLTGSAAVSQFLPMLIGYVPQLINQVGERTRKITLTVSWESPFGPQDLTVTQYFTVMNPEDTQPIPLLQETE